MGFCIGLFFGIAIALPTGALLYRKFGNFPYRK